MIKDSCEFVLTCNIVLRVKSRYAVMLKTMTGALECYQAISIVNGVSGKREDLYLLRNYSVFKYF